MRFAHTMIRVIDMDTSVTFYRDTLGLELIQRFDLPGADATLAFLKDPQVRDGDRTYLQSRRARL